MDDVKAERRCKVCNDILSDSNQSDQCRRHLITQERRSLIRRVAPKLEQDRERIFQVTENSEKEPASEGVQPAFIAEQVLKLVANAYGVTAEDILGHTRVSSVIRPRQVLMYLLHSDLGMSYPNAGEFLGRDHSTIMHSYRKVLEELATNAVLKKEILQFQKALAAMLP